MGDSMAEETRIIYHLEDQDTPYLIRINVPAQRVTLADFKHALNKPSVKFFFKSVDEDFGVVKEEISDDESRLPLVNGRVVVSSDTCPSDLGVCDSQSIATPTCQAPPPPERTGVIGQSRPPSFQGSAEELQRTGGSLNGHALQLAVEGRRHERTWRDGTTGDMLLQVNDIQFDNMNNDDAVRILRDIVHQPGPVTLTVAKCWDPNPPGFSLPMGEPVRPIDPAAWVSHTAAMTGRLLPHYGVPEDTQLSVHSDMETVVKAMASPEAGLEVRDRMWLKISIPNAFIGSDVVDWLQRNVEGFVDRREVRRYAGNLLKAGLIRHTVNKVSFSEQRYYVFRDPRPGEARPGEARPQLLDLPGTSGSDPLAPPAGPQGHPDSPYQDPAPHQLEAGGGAGGGEEEEED
ncbi:segment polarity protein dishevelled homolog DVL-3 [Mugil cephalus]|uniref:segment polarity protein dishevelled homolog DVL-3 n=1 Tax=Mugil cephalus TaxID=48193 RepID=UPI001FB61A8D|nr:segment polarity protein dishevelled homolog DVL-3 [Mugil cephalus]